MKMTRSDSRERRMVLHKEMKPEYRAATGDTPPLLVGYGAVFNRRSNDLGGFVEKVGSNFFTRTLQTQDVMGLFNHNINAILGRSGAGTMDLVVDEIGLRYEIQPPNTSVGRDVVELAQRGDLVGSSFSFSITSGGDSWGQTETGYPERTLLEGRLYDTGPVVFPAYPDTADETTRVALRSLAESCGESLDDLVRAARSNQLAVILSSRAGMSGSDDQSFDDIRQIVADAISDHLTIPDDTYLYVSDLSDTWAVYSVGNDYYRLEYSMDEAGNVTFSGDPVEVNRKTTWEVAPDNSGPRSLPPATATAMAAQRLRLLARR